MGNAYSSTEILFAQTKLYNMKQTCRIRFLSTNFNRKPVAFFLFKVDSTPYFYRSLPKWSISMHHKFNVSQVEYV